jgi:hypothetical protein
MELAVLEFAKDFGIPPWEVMDKCSANWWAWWKLLRAETSRYERSKSR